MSTTSSALARLAALAAAGEDLTDFALALLAAGIVRTGTGVVPLALFERLAGLPTGRVLDEIVREPGAAARWPALVGTHRGPAILPGALWAWLRSYRHQQHAPGIRRALDRIAA